MSGFSIFLLSDSVDESRIIVDGSASEWSDIESHDDVDQNDILNSNINIRSVSTYVDDIYISLYASFESPIFAASSQNVVRILIDTDATFRQDI